MMKQRYSIALVFLFLTLPIIIPAQDLMVLDDFEYEDDLALREMYSSSGWQGSGEAFLSDESSQGAHSMELYMTFDGGAWASAGVVFADREPFAIRPGQAVQYTVKGDPQNLTSSSALIVLQFRDANGEVIRYLDSIGPKAGDWKTVLIPYKGLQESPWDPNPDLAADRENLIGWEFNIQGVGPDPVDPFEATIWIDDLKIVEATTAPAENRTMDDFEYANDSAIQAMYSNYGWQATGTAFLSNDRVEGAHSMKLALAFDGGAWGGGSVISAQQSPFAFVPGQAVQFSVKGDPDRLTSDDAVLVFQFRDGLGEVIRFLDSASLKSTDWTTLEVPYEDFEEGPWDANPDVAADRNYLVTWEFYVQGVGGDAVAPFEAAIYIDDFKFVATTPPSAEVNYVVHKIAPAQAPNVKDKVFDAIYKSTAEEISTWEDDGFVPVEAPYDQTRAYLLTDGVKIYCGMLIADPDASTLTTDSVNDTLLKWQFDSWEIVFAPNPQQIDGANYIKFAGDSAGFWDDISPDADGGTAWSAPSFQTNAYIIDAHTWAAEFSVDIADIQASIFNYASYGHIGIQTKNPDHNFAYPDRASFGSRNARWDLSALNPDTPVMEWAVY
ncbi:MAG: hypothetical protein AB1656_11385 [Candidatus Omnitrophota bacterium]